MTWPRVIIFAVIMGVYTALCALLAPDGNSFHDIAVVMSPWVLPALIVVLNCKTPWEAAAKVFVFFLISQPLVYLIQVPFSDMGWKLFGYYPYWFKLTLATIPAGFAAWFCKKGNILSAVILSGGMALMALEGAGFAKRAFTSFPDGLLSAVVILGLIPVFIFGILRTKRARIIACTLTAVIIVGIFVYTFVINSDSGRVSERIVNAEYGITVDNMDKSSVESDNENITAELYENDGVCWVRVEFKENGEAHLTFENPEGEKYQMLVTCEKTASGYSMGSEDLGRKK